jgi:predicted nucleotidyltransferase component of viral defense system
MSAQSPIQTMLDRYRCKNNDERRNALKEIIQEIALIGLGRAGFFSYAAFYGGTAMRIFHGLERFSEDLDFSLYSNDPDFDLGAYLPYVRDELAAWGFDMNVEPRIKPQESAVQSAFIKGGTLIHLVNIASIQPPIPGVPSNELLKIKLEIDSDPPPHASYEVKYGLSPLPYSVRLYDLPSLFAGKIHALLCRSWGNRVKGRDFYDYIWFLDHKVPINIRHLEARLRQSGKWARSESLSLDSFQKMLRDRFSAVDFSQAKADIVPYIKDTRAVDVWDAGFFTSITESRLIFGAR